MTYTNLEHISRKGQRAQDLQLEYPNQCGQRLLPVLIDEIAATSPGVPFVSVLDGVDFKDISFLAFARAIKRCAWWMEENLGRRPGFPTISTFLDSHDLRQPILIFAAIKTGYKMFFSSPGNTIDTHIALLEATDCEIYLNPQPISDTAVTILSRRSMLMLRLPHLSEWLNDSDDDLTTYPYVKSYADACHDPFVVLHSSGTTGLPKVLVLRHGLIAAHDSFQTIPFLGGKPWLGQYWKGKRVFCSLPWFHGAGLYFLLPMCIYNGITPVVLPSVTKTDAAIADSVVRLGNVEGCLLSPSVLVDISRDATFLANLKRLDFVAFAGGPLPQQVGDLVSAKTRLTGFIGATEVGILPSTPPPSEDWQYYEYSHFLGHEFRHTGDGMYELFIVRKKELEPFQGVFFTFPDAQEYSMKDLYLKHPTKEDLWRPCGRADDVVVLLDARKLNPSLMEDVIESNPAVSGALICGNARYSPALLIQPATYPKSASEKDELLSRIWPSIVRANAMGPAAGKIALVKELVLFTTAERPMARAGGKLTIQRRRTLDIYEKELEQLYSDCANPAT